MLLIHTPIHELQNYGPKTQSKTSIPHVSLKNSLVSFFVIYFKKMELISFLILFKKN